MKLRPLLVLLLFVVSAGVLVWIYYAVTNDEHTAKNAPWTETIMDLDACSRRKHVKSAQYDHFAEIAGNAGQLDAASLFRALAFSERLGEQNCADAIIRLGGSYKPPMKVVVFRSTTNDNLNRSIAYEQQALDELNGEDIRRAFGKGNRYAARVLIWATAGDMRHIALMKAHRNKGPRSEPITAHAHKTADNSIRRMANTFGEHSRLNKSANSSDSAPQYLVCPVCGNIYAADACDVFCPFCLTDYQAFIGIR